MTAPHETTSGSPEPKKRLLLDPDLTDGEHWTMHDVPNEILLQLIRAWMDEAEPGDTVTIGIAAMTDEEADALPDI